MAAQLMLHSRLEELNNQSSDRLHSLRKRNEVKSTKPNAAALSNVTSPFFCNCALLVYYPVIIKPHIKQ